MKAVIYARTARKKTFPGNSIKHQVQCCREYAKVNDLEVTEVFADSGRSGASLDRPALRKMRALIARDSIRVIVIADLARLSRSFADMSILKKEFDKRGVSIRCVAPGLFRSNPR